MPDYRIWQATGIFLVVCGMILLLTKILRNRIGSLRIIGFLILSLISMVAVLSAINHFRRVRQSPYFVELGQFFQIPDKDNPAAPPVTIGDKSHLPDVSVSSFQGLITLSYEKNAVKADAPTSLVIKALDLKQPLAVREVMDNEGRTTHVIEVGDAQALTLPVSTPTQFKIALESVTDGQPRSDNVTFEVELRAENALLVVYRPKPLRTVLLADLPQQKSERGEDIKLVRISDAPEPASATGGTGPFIPTISVESGRQPGNVNAFLELPAIPRANGETRDFVVNNGLTKLGYSFGTEVPVGSLRGALITVESPSVPIGRWVLVITLLWVLPALFFLSSTFISRANGMWVLLPLVQMLLAVRFVLSLRVYLFPPYQAEGVEMAVLAAVFIPLMIFCGLFGTVVRLLPDTSGKGANAISAVGKSRFIQLWSFLKVFPSFYYWLSTLVLLPVTFYLLQPPTQRYGHLLKSASAFGWADFWQPLLVLLIAPPALWAITLSVHLWMAHRFRRSAASEFRNYGVPTDEPITYALENPLSEDQPPLDSIDTSRRLPEWVWWSGLLLLCAIIAGSFWLDSSHRALGGCLRLFAGAGAIIVLWKLRNSTVFWSRTVSVALEGLLVAALIVGGLWILQLLGLRSRDFLLQGVPIRTSAIFQLLAFALTMRMLTVFFFNDWKQVNDPLHRRRLWGFFTIFIGPLLLVGLTCFAAGDMGAILINWPPLLGMALVVTGTSVLMKRQSGKWRWAGVGLSLLLLAGVLTVFMGTDKWPGLSHRLVDEVLVKNMSQSTITHRLLLREGPARAETAAVAVGGEELIGAMEQLWKMLQYASHGGRVGYEQDGQPSLVPVAEGKWDSRGRPKNTNAKFALISLSDAVFSVYVLGEHGFWGGVSLLLLYVLLFVIVCWKALRSYSNAIMRITLLVGIALAITYPAIYVAAANVNGAIFTGQDMPLLGLRSGTDVLHMGILLALLAAGLAPISFENNAAAASRLGRLIARRNILLLVVLLVLLPASWTVWCLRDVTIANQEKYEGPFNLSYLSNKLTTLVDQKRIRIKPDVKLDDDRWVTRSVGGDLVPELIDKYNARPERGDDNDQAQWFHIDTKRGQLSVNVNRYSTPSPFRSNARWQGAITEGNEATADVLTGAGVSLKLIPASADDPVAVPGASYEPVDLSNSQHDHPPSRKFLVTDYVNDSGGKPKQRKLFAVYTMAGAEGAVLTPEANNIYLNGVPLYDTHTGKSPSVRLDYGDTIAVADVEDGAGSGLELKRPPRYLLTYQRQEPASFSYVAWFNGVQQRVYPQRDAFPSALLIAEAVEREAQGGVMALPLTVNARLNAEVYKLLGEWRVSQRLPMLKDGASRRIGVTLMDPTNGDLLALASDNGTSYDPEDDEDARALRDRPDVANVNFARHIIGSSVKPLTAAATLFSYPSLTRMTIIDERSDKSTVFGRRLGEVSTRDKRTEVSWDKFLPPSDNLYAVSLGLMGLTVNDGSGRVSFSEHDALGLRVRIGDGAVQSHQPRFVEDVFSDDPEKGENVGNLGRTPLAANYKKLFNVSIDAGAKDYDTSIWDNAPPDLLRRDGSGSNLFAISPERTNLNLEHVTKTYELRSILLGGEVEGPEEYGSVGSAWCNVLQAQALARIVTGKEVKSRLVVSGQPDFSDWPPGGGGPGEWRLDLLRGLQGVTRDPDGTAYGALHQFITDINNKIGAEERRLGEPGRYFTLFSKTGTLKKRVKDPDIFPDTIYMFAAGIWNDELHRLERPVVGVIYIEQGGGGNAQKLAKDLLGIINRYDRWCWSNNSQCARTKS